MGRSGWLAVEIHKMLYDTRYQVMQIDRSGRSNAGPVGPVCFGSGTGRTFCLKKYSESELNRFVLIRFDRRWSQLSPAAHVEWKSITEKMQG